MTLARGHAPGGRTPTAALPPIDQAARRAMLDEAVRGLLGTPKSLPAKLFYDERGAALFERICDLEEYYVTRAELSILRACARELAALAGPGAALVEYGSGAGVKVRLLLDAMESPSAYVPIDISEAQLARVACEVSSDYPGLHVEAVCADYSTPIVLPALAPGARRIAFFPGSTIGNLHPPEAAAFLRRLRRTIGPDGALVLGVDRRKDPRVLRAAYDDRTGVTAAFNLNVLARLNRELDADFDLAAFRHGIVWDDEASRIEMHLESRVAQVVHLGDCAIRFTAGETIWTESSYKYDEARFGRLVTEGGFELARIWTDPADACWVAFLTLR